MSTIRVAQPIPLTACTFTLHAGGEDPVTISGETVARLLHYVHKVCPNVPYFFDAWSVGVELHNLGEITRGLATADLPALPAHLERVFHGLANVADELAARLLVTNMMTNDVVTIATGGAS
jgi:hypothetical protein